MRRVSFHNPAGHSLAGILHPSSSDTCVVMCHCFLGDKDEWGFFSKIARSIEKTGCAVLRFDMRGCGESDDAPVSLDLIEDVETAIEYALHQGYQRIILLGHSLGGFFALQAQHPSIATRIALAPVTSTPHGELDFFTDEQKDTMRLGKNVSKSFDKGVRKHFEIRHDYLSQRNNIDQGDLLTAISEPVLIIHGSDDHVIDAEISVQAAPLLPQHSDVNVIRGANHDFDEKHEEVISLITSWLQNH